MTLHLGTTTTGERFELPEDALTTMTAIIGRRGSGKTTTALNMGEEFIGAGLPVVLLDPLGVHWGLRSGADGESAGLPVTILGGAHADLPLEETAGKLVAELVVEHPGAYIIDFSGFESRSAEKRFAADFAERLYRLKAKNPSALGLIVDEADTFAPQNAKGEERMLGAFEAIARRGRVRGLGMVVITQRPAVLNKNVLSQAELMIAHQLTAPQDRDALKAWAQGNATPEQVATFVSSLAGLQVGEAFVWSPAWLQVFERVAIRPRRTFDSSATPKAGETRVEPRVLAPVDLEALRDAMAASIEKAAADDPAALRARIRELEKAAQNIPPVFQCDHEPLIRNLESELERQAGSMARLRLQVADAVSGLKGTIETIGTLLADTETETENAQEIRQSETRPIGVASAPTRVPVARPREAPARRDREAGTGTANLTGLKAGARKILNELASRYPARWTRTQVGALTSFAHKGGTFTTYLGELKRRGLVSEENGELAATDAALEALGGKLPAPTTHAEVMQQWRKALKLGAYRMLEVIAAAQHQGVTREQLAEAVEMAQSGGTFSTYLGTLRRNGLVTEAGGRIVATDVVWP